MTNLPADLRAALEADFRAFSLRTGPALQAADGTRKIAFTLDDGESIESVLIPAGRRRTVCVSTQVGCPVGCAFCATGRTGFVRNLTPAEIVDQVVYWCGESEERVSNVVLMGMGEPLLNVGNVIAALRLIDAPHGIGIGARHITVSTSGIVPGIRTLANAEHQWRLAWSVHAANDQARAALVPPSQRYDLADIVEACAYYRQRTGRIVTLEYTLIQGQNDGRQALVELSQLARELGAKVNLIPCNRTDGKHRAPRAEQLSHAAENLRADGVNVTVRTARGSDIRAACGQLARSIPHSADPVFFADALEKTGVR